MTPVEFVFLRLMFGFLALLILCLFCLLLWIMAKVDQLIAQGCNDQLKECIREWGEAIKVLSNRK